MTNDRYSKAVLTVIAIALTVIAGQQLFQTATAQGATCGITKPCKSVNVYWDGNSSEWKTCDTGDRACYMVTVKK
jgi:hypothetical protein